MSKVSAPEANKLDLDAIKKALEGLESPKVKKARERATQFAALYETIRDLINSGVSKRTILDLLAAHDLALTYGQLDELLKAEAAQRGESVPGKDAQMKPHPQPKEQ